MGVTYIEGTLRGQNGQKGEEVKVSFLVDSGATYTLLPHDVWQKLGLQPKRSASFRMVDGTSIKRQISECYLVLPQGEGHTPVILGEPGDDIPLLGVVTLEILGLMLNPFQRTLQPMELLL